MATAPNKVTVILVRGLLGMIFSRGMDALAAKLSKDGYNTQVWNHSPFFLVWFAYKGAIAAEIERLTAAGQTVALVGHSFGANVLIMAARLIPTTRIPLLVAIDPAAQYDCTVPGNIFKAIGFRQEIGAIGRGRLLPKGSARITDVLLNGTHSYLDDDPAVHSHAIAEIKRL